MFSDTYKIELKHNCIYEVLGKHETRTEGDIALEGSNASAEEADEGTDTTSQSGIDVVLNHRLQPTGFGSKKEYQLYLKTYLKEVTKKMQEEGEKDEEIEAFKKNFMNFIKEILPQFSELEFYLGESNNPDGSIGLLQYKEVNGEERPVFLFVKQGLREVKC